MRLEYKYIVPSHKLDILRKALLPYVEYDSYSAIRDDKQYTVKSIYLDSRNLRDYRDKIEGVYKRKKIRIRAYNNVDKNSILFLEIKNKVSSHVYKNRVQVVFKNLTDFLSRKDDDYLKETSEFADAQRFLHYYLKDSLRPITLVEYEREAFFSKFDKSLRITFDKNLRFKKIDSFAIEEFENIDNVNRANYFILEIKFSKGFPKWLQKILTEQNLARKSYSKYVKSVDEVIKLSANAYSTDLMYRKSYV